MNVEFACVKRAGFTTPFGLLIFSQNGSERRAICLTDVPSSRVLTRFAATRLTALAQDALVIGCVGAVESKTHVLE